MCEEVNVVLCFPRRLCVGVLENLDFYQKLITHRVMLIFVIVMGEYYEEFKTNDKEIKWKKL